MLSPSIEKALSELDGCPSLPPLSSEAKTLLNLPSSDREDPKVLALIAQKDPIYLARLLAYANSAAYADQPLLTSAEAAVRRLGVLSTYSVLLACAVSEMFSAIPDYERVRVMLLKSTMNMTRTARKLTNWTETPTEQASVVWLTCLIAGIGIFAGLLRGGELASEVLLGVASEDTPPYKGWLELPHLQGCSCLSALIASSWGMDPRVVNTLRDLALSSPQTLEGKLVLGVARLISAAKNKEEEAPIVRDLFYQGAVSELVPPEKSISLASVT